ncbi:MAG: hydantoinase/oxoprolinase family protein [Thioalkalispiraceae bacterium]|jgi:N-methylhydantoinase A
MKIFLGVDTGGTFTDFVLYRDGQLTTHKVLSTPEAPERGILQGMRELGLADEQQLCVTHGSTVATNAVLEGKGVDTVYITNRGFRDMLSIGRQTRRELYNLQPKKIAPPVARQNCLETGGRLSARAEVLEALSDEDLALLQQQVQQLQPKAVAINLLFSYLDDRFEKAIEAALPDGLFISRASAVLPEFKEYERGITTWLNAYVGPLVEGYLQRLAEGAGEARITVMQSSGGTIAAEQAGKEAVHMLLSGPAGGLAAARFMGQHVDRQQLLTFDMGGTSTDVAMIDGELQLTSEGQIGDYPVAVPMVDMHTIGAGGGSIARVDAGGLLQVGPDSAGARPGPACYGRGGDQATVTDANLVLGRLQAGAFLGGNMTLDSQAARQAMSRVANELGVTVEQAAAGVIRIANEHMAHALRVMSVQRGIDPRALTLVSFGGAGGLHVCALADALNMKRALVPVNAGVLSALGMLVAPRERQLSRSLIGLLEQVGEAAIKAQFAQLAGQGLAALAKEGIAAEAIQIEHSVDLRYQGQSYYLNIAWHSLGDAVQRFHDLHENRYGHQLALPVELVNVRVALRSQPEPLALAALSVSRPATPVAEVSVHGVEAQVPVYARQALAAQQVIQGPALITETVSTTWLAPGWQAAVDDVGNLLLEKQ